MRLNGRLAGIVAAVGLIAEAPRFARPEPETATAPIRWRARVVEGELVSLERTIVERTGVPWTTDLGKGLLALASGEGLVIPIWPTESGQFFYRDAQLMGRKFRIDGRAIDSLPGIEAVRIRAVRDGKAYELYYWCDVCAIRMHFKADCTCCQGPVDLRETESP